MDYLFSIIKGAIRGFSETAGLSATGQGTLAGRLISFPAGLEQNALEMLLRLGIILAIVAVFYKNIIEMLTGFWKMLTGLFAGTFRWRKASRGQVTAVSLILASLPLLIAFLVRCYAYDYVVRFVGKPAFNGFMLLLTAAVFFLGDHSLDQNKELRDMKPMEAIKLGLFGVFALLPGLSPVAMAMGMGMNMGFKRKDAVEFAFLMAIPCLLAGAPLPMRAMAGTSVPVVAVALVAAFLAALGGIYLLKWLEKKDRLFLPTLFCGLTGVALIVWSLIG